MPIAASIAAAAPHAACNQKAKSRLAADAHKCFPEADLIS
jgi:hypothetical protein